MLQRDGFLHFSTLKHMARSAAHYREACLTPFEPTAAMRLGTLVHKLVLGGDYTVFPGDRRGKDWENFRYENQHKEIFTYAELLRAKSAALAVANDPVAAKWLLGKHEQSMTWNALGYPCKGTLDVLGEDFVCDLKTTSSTDPVVLTHHARKLWYHAQLAWYLGGARANGHDVRAAALVCVEMEAPHPVTVVRVMPRAIEQGLNAIRSWIERLESCEANGTWPGYVDSEIDLDVDETRLLIDGEELAA